MRVASFTAGLALWVLAAANASVPRPALAVLIVALLLVPDAIARRGVPGTRFGPGASPRIAWILLALGAPLTVAYSIEPGGVAAAFALPWLAGCALLAGAAAVDGLRSFPSILRTGSAPRLLRDASLVLLAVGSLFVVLERADFVLFGLSQPITLVTAIHFHVLGFGLVSILAALAATSTFARAAAYPLLIGIPITAAGFGSGSSAVEWIGAIFVVLAGLLAVAAMLRSSLALTSWRRAPFIPAAILLMIGIPMGLLWATAIQFGLNFVDFNTMEAVHGTLNTVGVATVLLALPALEP